MAESRDRPRFDESDAADAAREHWGLDVRAVELEGDVDRNFRLEGPDGPAGVLKIAREGSADVPLGVRQEAVSRVAADPEAPGLPVSIPAKDGRLVVAVTGASGQRAVASCTQWLSGVPFARFRPNTAELQRRLGAHLGAVGRALEEFDHPSLHRAFDWDLARGITVAARHADAVAPERRALFDRVFGRVVAASGAWGALPVQAIHGDANDYNVLVALEGPEPRLGLIDFGDMSRTWRAAEPAIASAYAAMDQADPVGVWAAVTAGYHAVWPLTDEELDALPHLVALRLCVSVALSAVRARAEPDDPYLVVSERPAWEQLARIDAVHPRLAAARIRAACGREPSPAGARLARWLRSEEGRPAFPVDVPDAGAAIPVLDLSVGGADLDGLIDPSDGERATEALARVLRDAGATVAVGRYLEPRLCYGSPGFTAADREPEFQRTVHLGIDLFAPVGTAVRAGHAGTVAAAGDNAGALDYGPTVLLHHPAEGGRPAFWSLYGHLDRESLERIRPGQAIGRGEAFARVGAADVNGGWPPHLHYQVIADRLDRTDADFPGVAWPSEAEAWAGLCPEPALGRPIAARYAAASDGQLRERRRRVLGPSLSLSYARPLHLVRGIGTWMFDERGRRYLDCVNNVCHVGHAHPRVVAALRRQAGLLATNTRYLHGLLPDYAERLAATLPAPLDTCFFVNSGSEANDLALRLARAATGRRGVIVVDGAYHGHLTSLVDISPYKFDGPGGEGCPAHVRVVRMPDSYRGAIRACDEAAAAAYAADVAAAAASLGDAGFGASAFMAEAILSCGGQVVPPDGYLREAARLAREAGAVYIADEVQTGFGRIGSHFWAFERDGVVPDIVTMGKPIGNGHPLGAVVTTRAIAESFATGMEYFNTYGGNPVSCAAGLAVLDVIRDEGLQERAGRVGGRLLDVLRSVQADHPLIGDVRGHGLFVGFELVTDPVTRAPAADAAAWLANRARACGVLLSTDGPDHNVIKIKPPLVFGPDEVDRLESVLRRVLDEDYLRRAGSSGA